MALKSYPAGYGEPAGDTLLQAKPLLTTGDVWYVLSTTGVDAAAPAGKQRLKPLATVGQAVTNSADGDDIVLMAGHTETRTTALAVNKRVRIIGGGSGAARPRLTLNSAGSIQINITVSRVQLRNLFITVNQQANPNARITVAASDCRIKDCYIECGATDTQAAIDLVTGGDRCRIDGTTIISVATLITAQPVGAIRLVNALTDLVTDGLIVDGGTVGWSTQFAVDLSAAIITNLVMENTSLLRDSDIGLNASTTPALVHVGTSSGSVRVA